MRILPVLILCSLAVFGKGQTVLDGYFINERWLLNAGASLLQDRGVDWPMLENAEPIRTYAVDEPYQWVKRVYLRLDPKDNPALAQTSPADSILPLVEIVNRAIDASAIDVYTDLEFTGEVSKPHVTAAPIILKVDFTYDTVAQAIVQHIVGLGFQEPDGRFLQIYFPELRYALDKYHVRVADSLVSCAAYFDRFLFHARRIERDDIPIATTCTPCLPSLEQQAEFDALTDLYLLEREVDARAVIRQGTRSLTLSSFARAPEKAYLDFDDHGGLTHAKVKNANKILMTASFTEGKPDGPYRAFYPNGHLKEEGVFKNGLREDEWTCWFPNGNIRSHRTYAAGRLNGVQRVYYANGTLWLEYGMRNGEYEGQHTTWYDDASIKASGAMADGFVTGEWDYAIRINNTLKQHLSANASAYDLPPGSWQDAVLSYHVTYTHRPGESNCLFDRCIQWSYSEVK
jgi:hypothetical protein